MHTNILIFSLGLVDKMVLTVPSIPRWLLVYGRRLYCQTLVTKDS